MRCYPICNTTEHFGELPDRELAPVRQVWLTPSAAASYLSVHPAWLAGLRSKGLPGPRFYAQGRVVRYHLNDLDSWLRGDAKQGAPDAR